METEKEPPESEIEYANLNDFSTDILAEAGMSYSVNVTNKGTAIHAIKSLPDDATWDDIQERINFVAGVRNGLQELDEGKSIPHQTVKEEFEEWLSR
jgi:predicted transcriptional regulator